MISVVIDWQESLLKDTTLTHQAKYIGLYLRTYMNSKSDIAWPSLARIAGETGLGRSTVCRHLNILEDAGWIVREKGNSDKNTRYMAVLPKQIEAVVGSVTAGLAEKGGSPRAGLGSPRAGLGVVPERDTNKQVNKQVINNSANFDAFWAVYPKKVDKKKSRLKFNKLTQSIQIKVISDVRCRAKSDRQWAEGYAPNPTTYLNGERWDDTWEKVNGESKSMRAGIDYV